MKIYLTGCCGLIGSNLSKLLISEGFTVVGIDSLSRGNIENIAAIIEDPHFKFIKADLKENDFWAKDMKSDDILIHLADVVAGIKFVFNNEWTIFNENLLINSAVSKAVFKYKPYKMVYAGTACSYPQHMQRTIQDSGLVEDDKFPADPESGYGWSKLIGDIEYNLLAKTNTTHYVNLDLHNVYGTPTDLNLETAQVIPSLVIKALSNDVLNVWGNGEQGRAFLHVSDVCRAFLLAITKEVSGTFMIGPRRCTTIKEVSQIIVANKNTKSTKIEFDTSKPIGDIGRFYSGNRSKDILGWEPLISLEDGINELINYVQENLLRR